MHILKNKPSLKGNELLSHDIKPRDKEYLDDCFDEYVSTQNFFYGKAKQNKKDKVKKAEGL